MKIKKISFVFLAATIFSLVSALTVAHVYAQTFIYMSPAEIIVPSCEEFTVDVNVEGVVDLYAWEIWMCFDPALMECISVVEGPFLQLAGTTFHFEIIDDTAGTIKAFGVVVPAVSGVSGSGTLANVTFHCSGPSESILDMFHTTLLNGSAELIWDCLGDANGDLAVNIVDMSLVAAAYGASDGDPRYDPNVDFDSNGFVDVTDVLTVALNYGKHCPGDLPFLSPINNVVSHSTINAHVTQTPETPVGGVWTPVPILELLAPWIAVALLGVAAITAGARRFLMRQ